MKQRKYTYASTIGQVAYCPYSALQIHAGAPLSAQGKKDIKNGDKSHRKYNKQAIRKEKLKSLIVPSLVTILAVIAFTFLREMV